MVPNNKAVQAQQGDQHITPNKVLLNKNNDITIARARLQVLNYTPLEVNRTLIIIPLSANFSQYK